jgi:putative thioredoxin
MDVTEATFASAVLERSKQIPVVVDFWAAWCAPCRQLGPVLERAVAARAGKVELAKLDTDTNPNLSAQYRIQGIPAVKAFKNGVVVSEFTGALPAAAVERFLDELVPSEADELVAKGDEASLRRALELQPGLADAALPLARMLLARGQREEAAAALENVTGSFAADGLRARISLERQADPGLQEAFKALDRGDTEVGIDLLIEALPQANGSRDEIRKVVVGILDELGAGSELARSARRRLASALY